MAHWERVQVPPDFAGLTRADRQGGSYLRYHPDMLASVSNTLDGEVLEYAADVSTALGRLGERLRSNPLPILYSTMIRSESISSSWIEGIRENARAIAIAQIGDEAASHNASSVIRNVDAMKEAIELLGVGAWTHENVLDIHHDLLPWHRPGYRTEQVWIGGSNKFNADYAGPPHELVRPYMDDLLNYANTSGDLPVVQAAIIHAQFETIHPFEDGNGRVGRALFHGILKRAGLVDGGVIPLSTVLRNDVNGYVKALTNYRYDGDDRGPALHAMWRSSSTTWVLRCQQRSGSGWLPSTSTSAGSSRCRGSGRTPPSTAQSIWWSSTRSSRHGSSRTTSVCPPSRRRSWSSSWTPSGLSEPPPASIGSPRCTRPMTSSTSWSTAPRSPGDNRPAGS